MLNRINMSRFLLERSTIVRDEVCESLRLFRPIAVEASSIEVLRIGVIGIGNESSGKTDRR